MEPRFGHDFSRVRIHSDAKAAESARAFGARAFTVGTDIAFAEGEYRPDTKAGQQLLAHELTHTVQQSGVDMGDGAGVRAVSGAPTTVIQCNDDPKTAPAKPQELLISSGAVIPDDCGGYAWTSSWLLAKDSVAGGHIVQHVVADYDIKNWMGRDVTSDIVKPHWDFWEAWSIKAGEGAARMITPTPPTTPSKPGATSTPPATTPTTTPPSPKKGGKPAPAFPVPYAAGVDVFKDPDTGLGSKGKIVVNGDAKFYEGIVKLPSDFIFNNPHTESKLLPSTTKDPKFTGGTANVDHDLTVEWDCLFSKSKTKIVSHKP
jgi:hypothetical protein